MSSTALRNSAALTGRTAYDHIPLEKLIRDGPPDGDWDNAVECARMKVLQQEIKSDSDGMVSFFFSSCLKKICDSQPHGEFLGTARLIKLC